MEQLRLQVFNPKEMRLQVFNPGETERRESVKAKRERDLGAGAGLDAEEHLRLCGVGHVVPAHLRLRVPASMLSSELAIRMKVLQSLF